MNWPMYDFKEAVDKVCSLRRKGGICGMSGKDGAWNSVEGLFEKNRRAGEIQEVRSNYILFFLDGISKSQVEGTKKSNDYSKVILQRNHSLIIPWFVQYRT